MAKLSNRVEAAILATPGAIFWGIVLLGREPAVLLLGLFFIPFAGFCGIGACFMSHWPERTRLRVALHNLAVVLAIATFAAITTLLR